MALARTTGSRFDIAVVAANTMAKRQRSKSLPRTASWISLRKGSPSLCLPPPLPKPVKCTEFALLSKEPLKPVAKCIGQIVRPPPGPPPSRTKATIKPRTEAAKEAEDTTAKAVPRTNAAKRQRRKSLPRDASWWISETSDNWLSMRKSSPSLCLPSMYKEEGCRRQARNSSRAPSSASQISKMLSGARSDQLRKLGRAQLFDEAAKLGYNIKTMNDVDSSGLASRDLVSGNLTGNMTCGNEALMLLILEAEWENHPNNEDPCKISDNVAQWIERTTTKDPLNPVAAVVRPPPAPPPSLKNATLKPRTEAAKETDPAEDEQPDDQAWGTWTGSDQAWEKWKKMDEQTKEAKDQACQKKCHERSTWNNEETSDELEGRATEEDTTAKAMPRTNAAKKTEAAKETENTTAKAMPRSHAGKNHVLKILNIAHAAKSRKAILKQEMKQDNPTDLESSDLDEALYKGNYAEDAEEYDCGPRSSEEDTEPEQKQKHAPPKPKIAMMLDAMRLDAEPEKTLAMMLEEWKTEAPPKPKLAMMLEEWSARMTYKPPARR